MVDSNVSDKARLLRPRRGRVFFSASAHSSRFSSHSHATRGIPLQSIHPRANSANAHCFEVTTFHFQTSVTIMLVQLYSVLTFQRRHFAKESGPTFSRTTRLRGRACSGRGQRIGDREVSHPEPDDDFIQRGFEIQARCSSDVVLLEYRELARPSND